MSRRLVAIGPATSPNNRFVALFAEAFRQAGWDVVPLSWRAGTLRGRVAIIHWPSEFFAPRSVFQWLRVISRLGLIAYSKAFLGTRWIWVAHNLQPHDRGRPAWTWRALLGCLGGIIHLSQYSRDALESAYPALRGKPALVTRHGDYRAAARTPPAPFAPATGPVRLVSAGWIRPYKNVGALIEAARGLAGLATLQIVGRITNAGLRATLTDLATNSSAVSLDLRVAALDEAELERLVDASDAVVLSYRSITNSGNALFALSRNRPVIAPAIGSLPELRAAVGEEWVFLYEGAIDAQTMRSAVEWVRRPRPPHCRLDAFSWSVVGPEIVEFAAAV